MLYDRSGGPLTDAALNSTKALLRLAELELVGGSPLNFAWLAPKRSWRSAEIARA